MKDLARVRIGLTGGIGSGKSTVAARLAERGATVIDADAIARQVVEPGTPALAAIAARFGSQMLRADGVLDRAALAGVVFADPEARAALEAITHPEIGRVIAERLATTVGVVVVDHPLLDRAGAEAMGLDAVVVVDLPEDVAVTRLVADRGFTEADARARIAAQVGREQRRAMADRVIDNGGDRQVLDAETDRLWAWAQELLAERRR